MPADPHRALVERYLNAYNSFDIPGMLSVLDPAIEFRNVTNGEITAAADGIEEFRKLAEHAAELFSSRRQTITSYAADGDRVTIAIDYHGVLAADLSPELRAGDTLRLSGRSTFVVRDGRITSIIDES
ncbi:MAG TPA: nuclear transport factor 2 family protein [Gemmatimonadaceae bacterium]